MNNSRKVLITSALPYVNNIPHLGNLIGSTLSGDVYARFRRFKGDDVIYLCGSDNYGAQTYVKALQEGITCKEICDKYHQLHKQIYDFFNIKFDIWGSTVTETQTQLTQEIFINLYKNGHIEEKETEQMYCNNCNMFLADRFLKGYCYNEECKNKNILSNGDQCDNCGQLIDIKRLIQPFCFLCKCKPELKNTHHLYLRLQDFTDKIHDYFINNDGNISISKNVLGITKSWLDKGLESRCITRDLLWGTPIPYQYDSKLHKYKDKVFYVWFDAPIGYFSILFHNNPEMKEWLSDNIEWVQLYSKDNVPFHTVIFPATIFGDGNRYPLVKKILSTDYLLYEGEKFSKSNQVGIFGDQVIQISKQADINEDYWRFYLLKIRPESKDSSFSLDQFISVINTELVNNIGNYINRCLSMSNRYGLLRSTYIYHKEDEIIEKVIGLIDKYIEHFENNKFKKALKCCIEISSLGNFYINKNEPWVLNKKGIPIDNILSTCNIILLSLLFLLNPFIPKTTDDLLSHFKIFDESISLLDDTKINNIYELKRIIISNNIVIDIEMKNYVLPFKKLHKKDLQLIS